MQSLPVASSSIWKSEIQMLLNEYDISVSSDITKEFLKADIKSCY